MAEPFIPPGWVVVTSAPPDPPAVADRFDEATVEMVPVRRGGFRLSREQTTFAPSEGERLMQSQVQRMAAAAARYAAISALLASATAQNERAVLTTRRSMGVPGVDFSGLRFVPEPVRVPTGETTTPPASG